MSDPTLTELAHQVALLEERMNTHQKQYESALDRLRADMANWKADMAKRETDWKTDIGDLKTDWKADMARRETDWKTDIGDLKTEMAKRDNRLILSVFGIMVAGITILGFVLTRTPVPMLTH